MPTYYITTLNIAIPLFISLILLEIFYAKYLDRTYVIRSMDTLSSLCSGLTNVIREFNSFLKKDDRVEKTILQLGDGITICRKI